MKCTFHIGQTKTHISHPYSCVQDHIAVQSSEQSTPITSGLTPLTTIRSDTKVGHASYPTNVCAPKAQNTKPVECWENFYSQLEQLNCV